MRVTETNNSGVRILGYDGPKGEERKVLAILTTGSVVIYEGPRKQEVPVRTMYRDGHVAYHTGQGTDLRTTRFVRADGEVRYYERVESGEPRLARIVSPEGEVTIINNQ